MCHITWPQQCPNHHEPGRLCCPDHSWMESIFNYHNSLGSWHAQNRARAAGLAYEVRADASQKPHECTS